MLSALMKGNAATGSFNDAGRSRPISRDRRRVLSGIAASCAGLAITAGASSNPLHPSPAPAQAQLHEPQQPCVRSQALASDAATGGVICGEKVRGCKGTGVEITN